MKLPSELLALIHGGENQHVEFKKSTSAITKDVYETVCSFSNRDGGHIFFGVKDDGDILGVNSDCIDKMKKDFTTAVNNEGKMYPPLYLTLQEYEFEGKTVLYVRVPVNPCVCRCNGKLYDRNHEADIDITNNEELVYKLYARKQNKCYVNKVFPVFSVSDLRGDLIERARKMASRRTGRHSWLDMTDEELLRSAGLILRDTTSGEEGITLASILLFGPDDLIMSTVAHYKTDAIFRVFNVDRYDDRDVVITNLLDSFDRLVDFGTKHLNDLFVLDGLVSVSARDKILREIVSNLLAHRDFSSAYVAKLIIERDRIVTENSNFAHGIGPLNLLSFEPFPKNPPISKVFREIGLADELGSGMRNTYKYTRLYSGEEPSFTEGDVFRTVIPLTEAATVTVGPEVPSENDVSLEAPTHVDSEIKLSADVLNGLINFCSQPRSRREMQDFCGLKSDEYFRKYVIKPMLQKGMIEQTLPDKPTSSRQRYFKSQNYSIGAE